MEAKSGNISILNEIADVLYNEPKEYLTILSHELSKGLSYPKARENAVMLYLNDVRKYANILSSPNNILGIEYLKAIKKLKSKINPITIQRIGSEYSSNKINNNLASSTAIRNLIKNNNLDKLNKIMPKFSYEILNSNLKYGKVISRIKYF